MSGGHLPRSREAFAGVASLGLRGMGVFARRRKQKPLVEGDAPRAPLRRAEREQPGNVVLRLQETIGNTATTRLVRSAGVSVHRAPGDGSTPAVGGDAAEPWRTAAVVIAAPNPPTTPIASDTLDAE